MSEAQIHQDDRRHIEQYVEAQWLERGLSQNTQAAYRQDLNLYAHWLVSEGKISLLGADRACLQRFLDWRLQRRYKATSSARMLSCLRGFYRYAQREDWLQTDPSTQLSAPKRRRSLPKTLTEADVEKLLAAPDSNTCGDKGFSIPARRA